MDRKGLRERLVKVKDAGGRSFDHGEFEIVVEAAAPRDLARSDLDRSDLDRSVPDRIPVHG